MLQLSKCLRGNRSRHIMPSNGPRFGQHTTIQLKIRLYKLRPDIPLYPLGRPMLPKLPHPSSPLNNLLRLLKLPHGQLQPLIIQLPQPILLNLDHKLKGPPIGILQDTIQVTVVDELDFGEKLADVVDEVLASHYGVVADQALLQEVLPVLLDVRGDLLDAQLPDFLAEFAVWGE